MILNKVFWLYTLGGIYSKDKGTAKKFWTSFVSGGVTVAVIPIVWCICHRIQQMNKIIDVFVTLVCTVGEGKYKYGMEKYKSLILIKIRDICVN